MSDISMSGKEQAEISRTTGITVFGKTINIKNYKCSINGGCYKEKNKPVKLQLAICPTFYCGGHCPFCSVAGRTGRKEFLDLNKLEKALKEMHDLNMVRGISLTGGEPFTDVVLLNEIVEMIFDIFGIEMEISINTNGSGLKKLHEIKRYEFIDAIHISRHHYDDDRNRAYFDIDVASGNEIREIVNGVSDPKLFVYNCLLLKDGIGTKEEMAQFLEFVGGTGVPKVGFVTPMPVNDYVKNNKVSYTDIFDRSDDRFLFTTCYKDYEYCHCCDGVYATKTGKLVEFYGRETIRDAKDYSRGLVYGPDNILRTGFSEDAGVVAVM
ncbi:MAG: radical SAM protein [Lachnospiraceae bacterium]|nr:radical SAM protein [Lachnospiraceae bacterium]